MTALLIRAFILCFLFPLVAFSQRLDLLTFEPNIDSFPVVKLKTTITENNRLPRPGALPSEFTISEDGKVVTHQLLDCDESNSAIIAVCLDRSTSMIGSAGNLFKVYESFLESFSTFTSSISAPTEYILIPFTDTIDISFPQGPNATYKAGSAKDSASFVNVIRNFTFFGNTNVDSALRYATILIEKTSFQQKAILLITDDFTRYPDSIKTILKNAGISLYVLELGKENAVSNYDLARYTSGVYLQATDSTTYKPLMKQIVGSITGEHCTLRYISQNPCPWYADHTVNVKLERNLDSKINFHSYKLGKNYLDTSAPIFQQNAPTIFTRFVEATEHFPCNRGIEKYYDSARVNFKYTHIERGYPESSSDSLLVIDTLQNASAYYIAIDSSGNRGVAHVTYAPNRDTIAPEISIRSNVGGNYEAYLTEVKPWDKGVASVTLSSGAMNLVLDSVRYDSRTFGRVWFHLPQADQSAYGCVEILDSAGNRSEYCVRRNPSTSDTLAPLIVQDPISEPRIVLTGSVVERRPRDLGIKQVTIMPLFNCLLNALTSLDPSKSTFDFTLIDSLQAARAIITASDSADNVVIDTIRYEPISDTVAPKYVLTTSSSTSRHILFTDSRAWDRGLKSITPVDVPKNILISTITYNDVHNANADLALINNFLPGSVVLRALDSNDNEVFVSISISASPKPLQPLIISRNASFGKVYAPGSEYQSVTIQNPNDDAVVITTYQATGATDLFESDLKLPLLLLSGEKKDVAVHYHPSLLALSSASFTIGNDTMSLGVIHADGQSIGRVAISVDTSVVAYAGMRGSMRLSLSAVPSPINQDSISFTLKYDGDLIDLYTSTPDCNGTNALCDYTLTYLSRDDNTMQVLLVRKNRNRNQNITSNLSYIDLPVIGNIARNNESTIRFEDIHLSQGSTAEIREGLVRVGDTCGDGIIRAHLNNKLSFEIFSSAPNPVKDILHLTISSTKEQVVNTRCIDQLGRTSASNKLHIMQGQAEYSLDTHSLTSGTYQLILESDDGNLVDLPIVVIR